MASGEFREFLPRALSSDGSVVVGEMYENSNAHTARHDGKAATKIARGGFQLMNRDGTVIVTVVGERLDLWRGDKRITIPDLVGTGFCIPSGISDDGKRVVGVCTASPPVAFLWDEAVGIRSIPDVLTAAGVDVKGHTIISATSICARGVTISGLVKTRLGTANETPFAWIAIVPR